MTTVAELETLYRARYAAFVRVAAAIAGDPARGADAVHDAFASAIERRRLVPRRGAARGVGLAHRDPGCRGRHGRARARTPCYLEGPAAPGDDPGIRALVAALPERQRLAVFLRYFADLDYRAIADALGVEVGTVSATLNAAHGSLRRSLEEARA